MDETIFTKYEEDLRPLTDALDELHTWASETHALARLGVVAPEAPQRIAMAFFRTALENEVRECISEDAHESPERRQQLRDAWRPRLRCVAWCRLNEETRQWIQSASSPLSQPSRLALQCFAPSQDIAAFLAMSDWAKVKLFEAGDDSDRPFSGRVVAGVRKFTAALEKRRSG